MENVRKLIKSMKFSISILYKSSKLLIIPYFVLRLVSASLPLFNIYLLKLILNKLTSASIDKKMVIIFMCAYIISIVLAQVISSFENLLKDLIIKKAENYYEVDVMNKLSEMPLSVIDTCDGRDLIDNVNFCKSAMCRFLFENIDVVCSFYSFIVSFLILIKFNVFMTLLFLILTIPGMIFQKYSNKWFDTFRLESAPDIRKSSYYAWMLVNVWPAKDVRMYNLTDDIKKRYVEEKKSFLKKKEVLNKKGIKLSMCSILIQQCGTILFTIYVIMQAANQNITIGEIALYTGLCATATYSFKNVLSMWVLHYTAYFPNFELCFKFNELAMENSKLGKRRLYEFNSLKFNNVFFKYPTSEEYVLKGVSFDLNKGDKLSIIGINGAGKSTIVKLMLGLYKVNSGEILINDYPMDEYDINDVRKLFSALFQSFASYPLTLRENIALSDLSKWHNDEEIIQSLKKSGIYDVFIDWDNFLDIYMTREFDDEGKELSKGQWQKIALSRAYFKNAPIIVFDEPSSALDPEAEDNIFENFNKVSKDKTSIMISHRISSAKISNKIIVLNNGVIEESGSHDFLISQNGLYSKLFNLQLKKYTVQ